ncbi:unnamed protein product [Parajaminaea phylloscopi]
MLPASKRRRVQRSEAHNRGRKSRSDVTSVHGVSLDPLGKHSDEPDAAALVRAPEPSQLEVERALRTAVEHITTECVETTGLLLSPDQFTSLSPRSSSAVTGTADSMPAPALDGFPILSAAIAPSLQGGLNRAVSASAHTSQQGSAELAECLTNIPTTTLSSSSLHPEITVNVSLSSRRRAIRDEARRVRKMVDKIRSKADAANISRSVINREIGFCGAGHRSPNMWNMWLSSEFRQHPESLSVIDRQGLVKNVLAPKYRAWRQSISEEERHETLQSNIRLYQEDQRRTQEVTDPSHQYRLNAAYKRLLTAIEDAYSTYDIATFAIVASPLERSPVMLSSDGMEQIWWHAAGGREGAERMITNWMDAVRLAHNRKMVGSTINPPLGGSPRQSAHDALSRMIHTALPHARDDLARRARRRNGIPWGSIISVLRDGYHHRVVGWPPSMWPNIIDSQKKRDWVRCVADINSASATGVVKPGDWRAKACRDVQKALATRTLKIEAVPLASSTHDLPSAQCSDRGLDLMSGDVVDV